MEVEGKVDLIRRAAAEYIKNMTFQIVCGSATSVWHYAISVNSCEAVKPKDERFLHNKFHYLLWRFYTSVRNQNYNNDADPHRHNSDAKTKRKGQLFESIST